MKEEKILTLIFIYQHPRILLGYKKRGFGAGRWTGFGGKVEEGESIEAAAERELKEEAGISASNLEKAGELYFKFTDTSERLKVHVFKANDFSGEEKETEEMKPQWFFIDEIPFKEMWSDSVYWMPLFFANRMFQGKFVFADYDTLLDREVKILN